MRYATVIDPTRPDRPRAAVQRDGSWHALGEGDLSALLASGALGTGSTPPVGVAIAGAVPVNPLPAPTKVICCGLNYGDHIAETGRERPRFPTLFPKYADTLVGPTDDVVLPAGVQADWEAELAVVVGAPLRRAGRDEAAAAVLGYTVANDVSVRDWQRRTLEWFQGKAWDATTPLGPVVVTPDEVDPAAGLAISCRVNGVEVQRDSTATLVFDAVDLLAYISTFTVLRPGDVVLTGTPGGIGMTRDPAWYLADGDVVETEVEGIGVLRNTVRLTDS
ncbi:MAG: fumarylacetoacetate hydrolase family protein [Nocardioides alkalitolerans]